MQHPQECRVVPDGDHVSQETVLALAEFHDTIPSPDNYSTLARQVFAADNLGDDTFWHYICDILKLPEGRINSSNRYFDVKLALRDKMRLKKVVSELKRVNSTALSVRIG